MKIKNNRWAKFEPIVLVLNDALRTKLSKEGGYVTKA